MFYCSRFNYAFAISDSVCLKMGGGYSGPIPETAEDFDYVVVCISPSPDTPPFFRFRRDVKKSLKSKCLIRTPKITLHINIRLICLFNSYL